MIKTRRDGRPSRTISDLDWDWIFRHGRPGSSEPDTEPGPNEKWIAAHLAMYTDPVVRAWVEKRLRRVIAKWRGER